MRPIGTVRESAEIELRAAIESKSARCAVIGLGFVGSTLVDALVSAGFHVRGYDRAPSVVERFRTRGAAPRPRPGKTVSVSDDPAILEEAEVVLVAVRVLLQVDGTTDLEPLRSAAAALSAHARPARLVLVSSTLPPGSTRVLAERWLDLPADSGCFVAHSPERLSVGHDWTVLRKIPHLVGGVDEASTRLGEGLLSKICEKVVPVSRPEVSELSKLLENGFISVGVALTGEITRIAHALGISAYEVCEAAASKPSGYHAFYPGPGIGGHCLPNDLRMLWAESQRLGCPAPLLEATEQIAALQPRFVVDRLEALLRAAGASLLHTSVLVVGVGFKVGSPDTTATPASDVIRHLRARGARPAYIDSGVPAFEVDGDRVERLEPAELREGAFPAGVVLAGDPSLAASRLERAVRVLLDAGGGRALDGALSRADRL